MTVLALWSNGNFSTFAGQYEVEEGNVEIDAPILKNGFVDSIDVSVAGRVTGYSTSGVVETWKIGLTSQITDDFKLRTTWSEDIRAPIISELFAGKPQFNRGSAVDPGRDPEVRSPSSSPPRAIRAWCRKTANTISKPVW